MAGQIEHVVIIVKENHTFDNYFGRFDGVNGVRLDHAPDPPQDDPNHRHEAWMDRAADPNPEHHKQYTETDVPPYFDWRGSTRCATTTTPRSLGRRRRTT